MQATTTTNEIRPQISLVHHLVRGCRPEVQATTTTTKTDDTMQAAHKQAHPMFYNTCSVSLAMVFVLVEKKVTCKPPYLLLNILSQQYWTINAAHRATGAGNKAYVIAHVT